MHQESSKIFVIFSFVAIIAIGILSFYLIKAKRENQYVWDLYNRQSQTISRGQQERNIDLRSCYGDECLKVDDVTYPALQPNDTIKEVLDQAIQDEYKSYALYQKIIERFGMIRPFAMVIRSEEINLSLLKSLYDKYGLKIPENEWINKVMSPEDIKKACGLAADSEMASTSLYINTLLPKVKDLPDISHVFSKLKDSSKLTHLDAFEKCK